jgi:hypothetical protein
MLNFPAPDLDHDPDLSEQTTLAGRIMSTITSMGRKESHAVATNPISA